MNDNAKEWLTRALVWRFYHQCAETPFSRRAYKHAVKHSLRTMIGFMPQN